MRTVLLLCLALFLLLAVCVSCGKPAEKEPAVTEPAVTGPALTEPAEKEPVSYEPDSAFNSILDYQEWANNGGSEEGAPSGGMSGADLARFRTGPGMPGYDSGRIVIGDSRCCQLGVYELRCGGDDYAVFAVWGGHYRSSEPLIPTEELFGEVEACFREQIKARGRCELFFFATVNDYDHAANDNAENIRAAVACAERFASMSFELNGKEYRPTVTVIGIEGSGSGGIRYGLDPDVFNRYIDDYNEALKNALLESPVLRDTVSRYTAVPELTGGNTDFIDDGLHYGDAALNTLVNFILGR